MNSRVNSEYYYYVSSITRLYYYRNEKKKNSILVQCRVEISFPQQYRRAILLYELRLYLFFFFLSRDV